MPRDGDPQTGVEIGQHIEGVTVAGEFFMVKRHARIFSSSRRNDNLRRARWTLSCFLSGVFRHFLILLAAWLGLVQAALALDRPLTFDELALMIRMGFPKNEIITEVNARKLAQPLDEAQSAALLDQVCRPIWSRRYAIRATC